MKNVWQWLIRCIPSPMMIHRQDYWIAPLGALIGILGTAYLSYQLLGFHSPWLIAPMGASAVLLFVIPASPLAQPWSVIGGNLIAAGVGVSCAHFIASPILASALAASIAIGLMMRLRCLHPPSGAVALTAVLGGPNITQLGYQFMLNPVLVNSVIIVAFAIIYHQFSHHSYPHQHKTEATPASPLEITLEDVESALRQHHELLDIDEIDLLNIVQETEALAKNRRKQAP
ncbi:MAG: HPP family protein [Candidatus Methylopumilus sp.]